MIVGFGSLAASTPYLGVILFIIVFAWLRAAGSLSKQFSALEIKEQKAKLAEEGLKPGLKYQFVSKVNEQVCAGALPPCSALHHARMLGLLPASEQCDTSAMLWPQCASCCCNSQSVG